MERTDNRPLEQPECPFNAVRRDVIASARQDERRRIATAMLGGLNALLGDESRPLLQDLADAAGLSDDPY